jgi:hypothetical protein
MFDSLELIVVCRPLKGGQRKRLSFGHNLTLDFRCEALSRVALKEISDVTCHVLEHFCENQGRYPKERLSDTSAGAVYFRSSVYQPLQRFKREKGCEALDQDND